jgi:hypothetical protein
LQGTGAPDTRIFSPLAVAGLCVTIGRYWYLFKRLTLLSAGRFYRFVHIVTYSSGKVVAKLDHPVDHLQLKTTWMPLFRTFPGLPIPGRNIQRFWPLKASSFSGFIKFYHRRFGQDSDSHNSLSKRLELFKEGVFKVERVAVLYDPALPGGERGSPGRGRVRWDEPFAKRP